MKAASSLAVASGAAASVGVTLTILTSHLLFALAQFAWQRMDCDGSDTNPCPQNLPPGGLLPNTIYTSRMNTKAGLNDKWGIGHRYAMGRYLSRAELIPIANALHNRSAKPLGLKATGRTPGLLSYACAACACSFLSDAFS